MLTRTETILIRGARQLLTLRGGTEPRRGAELKELGIIHDGSLLIRDGLIYQAGPTRRIENLSETRDAVEINAAGRVVMPGFVDSHTHLAFPPAGAADDESGARLVRASSVRLLLARCKKLVDAMARHGTTTLEVKTGCGLDEFAEIKTLRVLRGLDGDPLDVVASFLLRLPPGAGAESTDRIANELLPTIRRRRTAQFADIDWQGEAALAESFSRYLDAARGLGFCCKVHAQGAGPPGAVAAAVRCGAASVDHLENTTVRDAMLLANSPTVATLIPDMDLNGNGSNAPARALMDSGVAVALASNFGTRHGGTFSLQMVLAFAVARMGFSMSEAISAATINGAHAIRCDGRVGSLEPGKAADLLLLNVSDYRELARTVGGNLVHMTMKRGAIIYQEGDVKRPEAHRR